MPVYEYKCKDCGEKSEYFLKSASAGEDIKCKNCGSGNVEKILSASFVSMGSTAGSPVTRCGKDSPCCGLPEPCGKGDCDH